MSTKKAQYIYYTYCKVTPYIPGVERPTAENFENAIGNLMHRQFGDRVLSTEFRNGELVFSIPLRNATEGKKASIKEVDNKIVLLLNEYYKDAGLKKPLKTKESFVSIFGGEIEDGMKVECDLVMIHYAGLPKLSVSLSNIHKQIECKSLKITDAGKIKDSVLGILQIKGLENFEVFATDKSALWSDSISAHMVDKNVLACANELRIAKLYEFAKF
jgi:hypothetical protein